MNTILIVVACWLTLSIGLGGLIGWGMFRFKRNTSRNRRPHQLIKASAGRVSLPVLGQPHAPV